MTDTETVKHHPTLYRASGFGAWATCACGWKSKTYRGTQGAYLAFGDHLTETAGGRA